MSLLDIMSRYEGQAEEAKKNQEEKKEQKERNGQEEQTAQAQRENGQEDGVPLPYQTEAGVDGRASKEEQKNQEKEEPAENVDPYYDLKNTLQKQAVLVLNEKYTPGQQMTREEFVRNTVTSLLDQSDVNVPRSEREKIVQAVISEIIGLGPLDSLLANDEISEIMVNGPKKVFIEEHGKLHLTNVKFRDDEHVMTIVNRIVTPLGRHVDEASPLVDARLADGSRVNVIIPPLALDGPDITIRKFPKSAVTAQNLIHWGSASPRMLEFLEACVLGRENTLIIGGTGGGKTTLLNVLSNYIPANERIVTIEDSAELQLQQDHVVRLEARPANAEGKGRVAIRDLVINALRMRPDRIVVGECRGGETLDMLTAMNTGHDGSLTTAHANSPRDALSRLETMVMMAGMELPEKAIRQQISSAINIIVQQARLRDGSRKIISISEITGMEGTEITMQEIYHFRQTGIDDKGKIIGVFEATGVRPNCIEKLQRSGALVRDDWFVKGTQN